MNEREPKTFHEESNEKQARWDEVVAEVNEVTDGLGHPIEEGIKETVIVANVLGFKTNQSCEGHLDWSERAPWLDFTVTGVKEKMKEASKVFRRAEEAHTGKRPAQEIKRLFEEAHAAEREAIRPLLEKGLEMIGYLDRFYTDRHSTVDSRLILDQWGAFFRLINQGAKFQAVLDEKKRAEKLGIYQQEMKDFTEFLKQCYFQE